MCHRLIARERYLSPPEVVTRLKSEFAYVESSVDDGQRHVLEVIQQLQALARGGRINADHERLKRLAKLHQRAVSVHFGDEPISDMTLLSTPLVHGEPLFFEYSSRAHEETTRPLLVRCAAVLGYEIVEDEM